jgi:hypothetical protein
LEQFHNHLCSNSNLVYLTANDRSLQVRAWYRRIIPGPAPELTRFLLHHQKILISMKDMLNLLAIDEETMKENFHR